MYKPCKAVSGPFLKPVPQFSKESHAHHVQKEEKNTPILKPIAALPLALLLGLTALAHLLQFQK